MKFPKLRAIDRERDGLWVVEADPRNDEEVRARVDPYGQMPLERAEAFACLLAAATDLLEAAEQVAAELDERIAQAIAEGGTKVPVFRGLAALNAAIAKAKAVRV